MLIQRLSIIVSARIVRDKVIISLFMLGRIKRRFNRIQTGIADRPYRKPLADIGVIRIVHFLVGHADVLFNNLLYIVDCGVRL